MISNSGIKGGLARGESYRARDSMEAWLGFPVKMDEQRVAGREGEGIECQTSQ